MDRVATDASNSHWNIRCIRKDDVKAAGALCYRAFETIDTKHGFIVEFASEEATIEFMEGCVDNPHCACVVVEDKQSGKLIGGNCLWDEGDDVHCVGPIYVDPSFQGHGLGRTLMQVVVRYGQEVRKAKSIRLTQAFHNMHSFSLYSSLGFQLREPVHILAPRKWPLPESCAPLHLCTRASTMDDVASMIDLCRQVHGFARSADIIRHTKDGKGFVVENVSDGKLMGYAVSYGEEGHAVGMDNDSIKALICACKGLEGCMGIFVPSRNHELIKWCLSAGMRTLAGCNIMTLGEYTEPKLPYLPSIGM